jgi:hypothetical protein
MPAQVSGILPCIDGFVTFLVRLRSFMCQIRLISLSLANYYFFPENSRLTHLAPNVKDKSCEQREPRIVLIVGRARGGWHTRYIGNIFFETASRQALQGD